MRRTSISFWQTMPAKPWTSLVPPERGLDLVSAECTMTHVNKCVQTLGKAGKHTSVLFNDNNDINNNKCLLVNTKMIHLRQNPRLINIKKMKTETLLLSSSA